MTDFPALEIPADYFSGLGNIVGDAASPLRVLLNGLRPAASGRPYHVNPAKRGAFPDFVAAVETADAELAENEAIVIAIDPDTDIAINGGAGMTLPKRSVFLRSTACFDNGSGQPAVGGIALPRLFGDLTLQNCDDQPQRRVLSLEGIGLDGKINTESNQLVSLDRIFLHNRSTFIARTHGANGCPVFVNRLVMNNGQFLIDDQDTAPNGNVGRVIIANSDFILFPGSFLSVRKSRVSLIDVSIILLNFFSALTVIDGNGESNAVDFRDVVFENLNLGASGDTDLFANMGSSTIEWFGAMISQSSTASLDMGGNQGTHTLGPEYHGPTAPLNPTPGTIWKDTTAFAVKMWNGGAWV